MFDSPERRLKYDLKFVGHMGLEVRDGRMTYKGETQPIAGAEFSLDEAGYMDSRVTLTRVAAVGVFALAAKKKVDKREMYLNVRGPERIWSIKLSSAKYGEQWRRAVAQLNNMAAAQQA